jgi:hypothetical protein
MKGMHGIGLCAAMLLSGAGAASATDATQPTKLEDFAYRLPLTVPPGSDGALLRVTLTPSVYHNVARADLGDLRVFNAQGQALPYSLVVPVRPRQPDVTLPVHWFPLPPPAPGRDLPHLVVQIEQQSSRIALSADVPARMPQRGGAYLVDLSPAMVDSKAPVLDGLDLDWTPAAGGLDQAVSVESSDDLTHWNPIGSMRILQLDYLGQTLLQNRLDLHGVQARYLRLSWQPDQTPPSLTRLGVKALSTPVPVPRVTMSIPRDSSVTESGAYAFDAGNYIGAESLQLELPRGCLIVATVLVRDDPAQPWRVVAKGDFFHVVQDNKDTSNIPLDLGGVVHARYWLVRADPRSSSLSVPPEKLSLIWTPRQLVFMAQPPGPYVLTFGNPAILSPSLPIVSLMPDYIRDPVAALAHTGLATIADSASATASAPDARTLPAVAAADVTLKAVNPAALMPAPPPSLWQDWKTWVAWSLLCTGVLLLGWMAWRLIRQMREAA